MIAKSILVVEDEPLVGMELQEGLHRLGYHVPELVLMDIRIQGNMDGIQATARLRETSDVPVLFLTAYSDSPTIRRVAEILPDGYLLKPFEEKELAANIEMLLLKSQSKLKEEKSLRKMFPLGRHHFAFHNLDVAGHGPLPAMIAYSLHPAIRDLAREHFERKHADPSPGVLLTR